MLLEHQILLGELSVQLFHFGFQLINVAIPFHYGSLPLNQADVPLPQGLLQVSVIILQGLGLLEFDIKLILDVIVKFFQLLVLQCQFLQSLS